MRYVISLGGSLVSPDGVDASYVKKFVSLISLRQRKGDKFYIVVGGGSLARRYQASLKKSSRPSAVDLDWIGIAATKMNAEFVRLSFGDHAGKTLILDPTRKIKDNKPVQIIPGWKPGRSSDYEAVLVAKNHGVSTVINLSNVDYVYDKDPKKYSRVKKIKNMDWSYFFKLFGRKWNPGSNVPFDQTAARLAKESGVRVIIMNGKKLKNFSSIFDKKSFSGTIIQ